MYNKKTRLTTKPADEALRVGSFQLLPINPAPPVITSHPVRNFQQLTWESPDPEGRFTLQSIEPVLDTFVIRKNTAVSFAVFAYDPSNVNNPNDLSNLTYVWKRNNQPLFQFNKQNNYKGTSTVEFTREQATETIIGEYVCEISNEYGTTTTIPFVIEVIEIETHPSLYVNVLSNGDGDGGTDGWDDEMGLISTQTCGKTYDVAGDSTLGEFTVATGSAEIKQYPFHFTTVGTTNLFYPMYDKWLSANSNVGDITQPAFPTEIPGWMYWYNTSTQASNVIANEDLSHYDPNTYTPQGFFPGAAWIDRYNENDSTTQVPLKHEMNIENNMLTYFTRNPIEFGEAETAKFSQRVELPGLANLIQGKVAGIENLTSQFFAYVGIAISRFIIRATVDGQQNEYSWYVRDLATFRGSLEQEPSSETKKVIPDEGTAIEIVPIADDRTEIDIKFIDRSERILKKQVIKGPTIQDLWAVKEKVNFPLTLFPIFQFFENNSNPIQVFGRTYTTTNALTPFFFPVNGQGAMSEIGRPQLPLTTIDRNAAWVLARLGQGYYEQGRMIPKELWQKISEFDYREIIINSQKYKAVEERGASAFFAVGNTTSIPPDTVAMSVEIRFANTSPARNDDQPESKGWTKGTIYNSLYEVNSTGAKTSPNPLYEYGNPRCAITKMKLQIVPNRDIASPNHTTYAIPPATSTVAGLAKEDLFRDVHNTSEPGKFAYNLIQPTGLPPRPKATLTARVNTETEAENEFILTRERPTREETPIVRDDDGTLSNGRFIAEQSILEEERQAALEEEGVDEDVTADDIANASDITPEPTRPENNESEGGGGLTGY